MAKEPHLRPETIATITGLGLPAPTPEGVARMRERLAATQAEIDSGRCNWIREEGRDSGQ